MTTKSSYRWIPWSIGAVMAVVVAVNIAFAYFAFSSSPGLVTEHPYDEGNGYNAVIDAGVKQDALGWNGKVSFNPRGDNRGDIDIVIRDRTGKPVQGLSVAAHVERPIEPLPQAVVRLPEAGDGMYRAGVELPRPGQWEVRVVARRGETLYEFNDRIFVK